MPYDEITPAGDRALALFDRYLEAWNGNDPDGLGAVYSPDVVVRDGTERGGLANEADERYEGDHTVVVCFQSDRLLSDRAESGWFETAAAYRLRELAHAWMIDHRDDGTRAAFNERAGLQDWRNGEAVWRDRGVEHAAFPTAWGLAGTVDARYPILPPPGCDELAVRYELLTGRRPITTCEET